MNLVSRTITGGATIILGLFLVGVSFYYSLFILIYGIPLILIGIFILFNKKEDEIEKRKDERR